MNCLRHTSSGARERRKELLFLFIWILVISGAGFGTGDLQAQASRGSRGKKPARTASLEGGRFLRIDCGRGGHAQIFKTSPSRSQIQQPDYVVVAESIATRVEFVRGVPLHIAVVPAKGLKVDSVWVDEDIIISEKSFRIGDKPKVSVPILEIKSGRGMPTLHARFKVAPAATIVASSGANGAISPAGVITVEEGETQLFMIKAAPNFGVADVMVDGKSMGPIPAYAFTNVKGTHTIGVLFVSEEELENQTGQYKLIPGYSIFANSGPHGSISPSGSVSLDEGGSQTFNFLPDKLCRVSNVIVDGLSLGPMKQYTFRRIIQSHTITVQFMKDPALFRGRVPDDNEGKFTVTASATGDGWISPDGVAKVEKGSRLQYTITPVPGNSIADVIVDGTSMGQIEEYVFPQVDSNHTIEAKFLEGEVPVSNMQVKVKAEMKQFYINASTSPDSGGTVIPGGDVTVNENEEQEFLIVPNAGYVIGEVFIDGRSIGKVQRYMFTEVTAPHSIEVRFEKQP